MTIYRQALPQLSGDLFLSDAGLETDLMFNEGIEIPDFATHTLLPKPEGRAALARYYRKFLLLARERKAGFILDTQTWKAHMRWAEDLGATVDDLIRATRESVEFAKTVRSEFSDNDGPIVISGVVGPCGDAYAPEKIFTADEAEEYHTQQIGWLSDAGVDMVSAFTMTQCGEAIGIVRAAQSAGVPAVISFTLETDGRLPTSQPLAEAISEVDEATGNGAAYFMLNCSHPTHFSHVLEDAPWSRRIRGVCCNASRKSHAELDQSDELDAGDPVEFGRLHGELKKKLPWLNVFGGCCGCDFRHVSEITRTLFPVPAP
jgi:homocysteine S-methyltransferase